MTTNKNIPIHNIYYMLAYAFRDFRFNMFEDICGENFEDTHNLFAEILIRCVSSQLKQGLYKTYVSKDGALPAIRGRIDMLKTYVTQRSKPNRAFCNYDELSVNNPYNQVVKTTLQYLAKCSDVDENCKQTIRQLIRYFTLIDPIDMATVRIEQFRFDRNNQNYQFLIYICLFIFNELLMTTDEGPYKLKTLSDDQMARLFEKFVLEYYRRHHPDTMPRAAQIKWDIIEEESTISILPNMQTDILLSIGERTLIIDTKYYSHTLQSNYNNETIHSNNLYQIFTYVRNCDVGNTGKVDGMLLYAKTEDAPVLNDREVLSGGNVIYFRTLDLNRDFKEIANQLDSILKLG